MVVMVVMVAVMVMEAMTVTIIRQFIYYCMKMAMERDSED